jgi:hypothetical protein
MPPELVLIIVASKADNNIVLQFEAKGDLGQLGRQLRDPLEVGRIPPVVLCDAS